MLDALAKTVVDDMRAQHKKRGRLEGESRDGWLVVMCMKQKFWERRWRARVPERFHERRKRPAQDRQVGRSLRLVLGEPDEQTCNEW